MKFKIYAILFILVSMVTASGLSSHNVVSAQESTTVQRIVASPEVSDYSVPITAALNRLMESGGGTLIIPYGKYPVLKQIVLNGTKAAKIIIRGEKNAKGELPVLFDHDTSRNPHAFLYFTGEANNPSLSIWVSNLEFQGNNVPLDWSKGNVPFILDEGQTDTEPNRDLPPAESYGHPFFFRKDVYSSCLTARNLKTFHVDNVVIRDFYGTGIMLANYGNGHWGRNNRMQAPTVKNSKILNTWGWHRADDHGDGIIFWNVDGGSIENNQIVNDLKHTRWIGRCGVVLERNSEKVKVLNNTVSGYCRNVHIELTFGGHEVVGNKLLATDLAIILNEPDRLRPSTAVPFTKPVLIQNNVIEYAQERERYGIHPFGGPRSFIYIDQYRSNLALDGSKILDNKFTYRSHKGVKVNRWREYDVRHKTQHLYIRNQYIINNWLERGNKFN